MNLYKAFARSKKGRTRYRDTTLDVVIGLFINRDGFGLPI
jgi:hypothetical protein